ncbi:hypothetical protein NKI98_18075 [Mesorhizobium sp. M0222]|uniref:hypothetical protein n=1 Tax=Mesorhizobium sp. M0222 TaxID=2956921 RepID=UPI00333B357A
MKSNSHPEPEPRFRAWYPLRYDDPCSSSLLGFLIEGFRIIGEAPSLSPFGGHAVVDPSYSQPTQNMLNDHNSLVAAVESSLRRRAIDLMTAAGVEEGAPGEPLVTELVRAWRNESLAVDLLSAERVRHDLTSPAARAIGGVCILLRSELNPIRDTPLYAEVAKLMNRGASTSSFLAGRHMRAGASRWRADLVSGLQKPRRIAIPVEDLMRFEVDYTTQFTRALLVLWSQAPNVDGLKSYQGAALAQAIDDQDGLIYRIGKAHDQPLRLRQLYDSRR